jgi:hypothetical protein
MTTLSQSVIDAGARVGRIVKYYETVAALIASTDTVAEGEFVQAEHYFYKGAASGATDHHVRMNSGSGSKLYCIANPYVTPDQFGATPQDPATSPYDTGANNTTYVQAALNSGLPVYLNRLYRVTSVYFPQRNGIVLHGAGKHTGPTAVNGTGGGLFCKLNTVEYILQTFTAGATAETGGHSVRDFAIYGVGKRGLVVAQTINSVFENIFVAINASDGPGGDTANVVYEQSFSNVFINLECGFGCKVDLRINQTCLDTEFIKFYTNNNAAMHHIEIDNARKDLAYMNSAGNGLINFQGATLQGARSYAIKMRGQSSVNFRNTYTEVIEGFLLVKDCDQVNFFGGEIYTGETNHCMWIDQTEGSSTQVINFFGTAILNDIVVGDIGSLGFYGANFNVDTKLFKTNATYKLKGAASIGNFDGSMQIVQLGEKSGNGSKLLLKSNNSGNLLNLTFNDSGTATASAFAIDDVALYPLSPVAWFPNYNPTFASGAPITPFTIGVQGGTSPYTFTIIGDFDTPGALPPGLSINSGTGQISGTPTTPGTYLYKVRVTDSGSGTSNFFDDTGWQTITIT